MLSVNQKTQFDISPEQALSRLVFPAVETLSVLAAPSFEKLGIRLADEPASELVNVSNLNFSIVPLDEFVMPSLSNLFSAVSAEQGQAGNNIRTFSRNQIPALQPA